MNDFESCIVYIIACTDDTVKVSYFVVGKRVVHVKIRFFESEDWAASDCHWLFLREKENVVWVLDTVIIILSLKNHSKLVFIS